jgi:hypothetical protein
MKLFSKSYVITMLSLFTLGLASYSQAALPSALDCTNDSNSDLSVRLSGFNENGPTIAVFKNIDWGSGGQGSNEAVQYLPSRSQGDVKFYHDSVQSLDISIDNVSKKMTVYGEPGYPEGDNYSCTSS